MVHYTILACLILILIYSFYCLHRIYEVYKFRNKIIDLCYEYNRRHIISDYFEQFHTGKSAYDWFLHKYSSEDMVFSFKKLKLESWYTEKEINKLLN